MRQREGDQRLPAAGAQNVSEAVKADLDERIRLGIQRYGRPLETFNGRDALLDAYQEALDLAHYLKQAILERDAQSKRVNVGDTRVECDACWRGINGPHPHTRRADNANATAAS